MPTKCVNCGEDAVVWDDYSGTAEQQVCSACGVVHCDGNILVSERTNTNLVTEATKLNGLPDSFVKYQMQKMPEGLKVGKVHIRTLCSNIKVGTTYQTEALEQFQDLFHRPDFKRASIETKTHLASWCVYISCRKAGLPITMQYVANLTGQAVHKLFRIHKHCKEIMSLHLPLQDITELIETVLANELKAEITYTETTKQLTKDIVMLCKELWLVDGRQTHLVLLSVFFIAWQAESFIERKKVKLTKICKHKSSVATCRERVSEFKKELCKLAQLIPWVSSVTVENVTYYVKDVVKYQRSLMLDAFRKSKERENQADSSVDNHSLKRQLKDNNSQNNSEENSSGDEICERKDVTNYVSVAESGSSGDSLPSTSNCADVVANLSDEINCKDKNKGNKPDNVFEIIKREPTHASQANQSPLSLKAKTEYFKKMKKEVEEEHMFTPPSFKKARRKSIEQEEVLHFVQEGRKMMEHIASKFNGSP